MVLKTTDWVIKMAEDAEHLQPAAWVENHSSQVYLLRDSMQKQRIKQKQKRKGRRPVIQLNDLASRAAGN
jgi:hypothetical protein